MKIPCIDIQRLWHWGSLEKARKYERGSSYEGNLFSMSACPEAWRQIARLGGNPLYATSKPMRLLDMHSILLTTAGAGKALREHIIRWGVEKQLLERKELFYFSYFDDELGREVAFRYTSHDEALDEHGEDAEGIEPRLEHVGTSELIRLHNFPEGEIIGVEYAIIEWARRHVPKAKGVYWDEQLDPDAFSAPRAGLFDVEKLSLVRVDEQALDDDEGLDGVGQVVWVRVDAFEQSLEH